MFRLLAPRRLLRRLFLALFLVNVLYARHRRVEQRVRPGVLSQHVQGHGETFLRQQGLRVELAELLPEDPPRALQEKARLLEVLVLHVDHTQLGAQLRDVRVVLAHLRLQKGEAVRHERVLVHEAMRHPLVVERPDGPRTDRRRIRRGWIAGVEIKVEVLPRVHRGPSTPSAHSTGERGRHLPQTVLSSVFSFVAPAGLPNHSGQISGSDTDGKQRVESPLSAPCFPSNS